MAVAPTGAIYKALKFDNVSSRTYGVYITGEAVYNAPARDVEMITIPGRSGTFALDNGRFENIEVTYPAGIYADTEADFRQAISDFRNFLCSRKGYVRLQDEYNPGEYRMAVYKSGLDVDPAMLRAGEFKITFDCKPQRWLTSGETATTMASGGTLTNPTLFEASPLLEVEGYGTIDFNGYEIELTNETYGEITLTNTWFSPVAVQHFETSQSFDRYTVETGDIITLEDSLNPWSFSADIYFKLNKSYTYASEDVVLNGTNLYRGQWHVTSGFYGHNTVILDAELNPITFSVGTAHTETGTLQVTIPIKSGNTVVETVMLEMQMSIQYNGTDTITVIIDKTITNDTLNLWTFDSIASFNGPAATTNSTATYLGHPTYIDCDLGEAYKIQSNKYMTLNKYIDLGSKLPTLAVGSTEITFDNTITDFKIVPRWWKV